MVLLLPTTTSFHSHWSNPSKTRIMQTLVLNGFLDMGSKSCKISCCSRHNHIMSQHLTKSRIQPSFTKRWSSHLLDSLMAGPYATRLSVTNDPRLSGTTFSPVINRFSPFLSLFFFFYLRSIQVTPASGAQWAHILSPAARWAGQLHHQQLANSPVTALAVTSSRLRVGGKNASTVRGRCQRRSRSHIARLQPCSPPIWIRHDYASFFFFF